MRSSKFTLVLILAFTCLIVSSCATGNSSDNAPQRIDNKEGSSKETGDRSGSSTEPSDNFKFTVSDFTLPKGAVEGPGVLGPWNKQLVVATSKDGNKFRPTGQIVTDQGDVPDLLATENGTVYLYYTGWTVGLEKNKTAVAISYDNGTSWIFKKLDLDGFENMSTPVDPDVIYDKGKFRIFLTSDSGDGPKTFYAEGVDGVHFEKKGIAFEVEDQPVLDPTVLKINNVWHLFAGGVANKNWHAISDTGRSFRLDKQLEFEIEKDRHYQFSNGINTDDRNVFFAYSNNTIRSFRSADGETWEAEYNNEFPEGADPAVAILNDGTYLMVYTSRMN